MISDRQTDGTQDYAKSLQIDKYGVDLLLGCISKIVVYEQPYLLYFIFITNIILYSNKDDIINGNNCVFVIWSLLFPSLQGNASTGLNLRNEAHKGHSFNE